MTKCDNSLQNATILINSATVICSIITNKDDLHKENVGIKQLLKENGYQESIINKIFRRITINHNLPQLQQLWKPHISKRRRSE